MRSLNLPAAVPRAAYSTISLTVPAAFYGRKVGPVTSEATWLSERPMTLAPTYDTASAVTAAGRRDRFACLDAARAEQILLRTPGACRAEPTETEMCLRPQTSESRGPHPNGDGPLFWSGRRTILRIKGSKMEEGWGRRT